MPNVSTIRPFFPVQNWVPPTTADEVPHFLAERRRQAKERAAEKEKALDALRSLAVPHSEISRKEKPCRT